MYSDVRNNWVLFTKNTCGENSEAGCIDIVCWCCSSNQRNTSISTTTSTIGPRA